jgi:orotate phosphoribosyltransferase
LTMSSARAALLQLLARKSFRLGEFTLSSGGKSDYYVDCRATTLDAEGSRLTSRVIYDEILARQWHPQGIGGLTLGADPIVVGVAILSAQQGQSRSAARGGRDEDADRWYINGFLVRKAEKGHGMAQRIEGFRERGARVVIVDDVCTTGASTNQALVAAREFGFEVVGAICLVEREEAGGRKNVERMASPAPFVSIFTAAEIRREHLRLKLKEADPLFAREQES